MNATQEMILLSVDLHLLFVILLILVKIRVLFLLNKRDKSGYFAKKYEAWALYDRALLSTLFFSGITVMAVRHFSVAWQVWLMVVVSTLMIYLTIQEFIRYKYDKDLTFINFAKKKYIIEIVAILLICIVSLF